MRVKLACATVGMALGLLWSAAQVRAGGSSDKAALRHIKEVLWPKAYAEQDVALLGSILADEFQSVDAEGRWSSKQEELDYVRAHRPSYESLTFKAKRLDVLGSDTAIVGGEGTIKGRDAEGAYVMTYQSTNVFVRRAGRWQAVASHISGVKRGGSPTRG